MVRRLALARMAPTALSTPDASLRALAHRTIRIIESRPRQMMHIPAMALFS